MCFMTIKIFFTLLNHVLLFFQSDTVTSSVTTQTQTIVGNGQIPSNPQPVNTTTVQTSSGNSSSATSSSAAPTSEDALPIPILPVQTVEAMAAAAKGGVRSIKQLISTLQGSTDEVQCYYIVLQCISSQFQLTKKVIN